MKRIPYLFLIAVLFVLQACSSGGTVKQELAPPVKSGGPYNSSLPGAANTAGSAEVVPPLCSGAQDTNTAAFAAEVIRLVNVERAKVGVAPVANQTQLAQAAQKHSIDMGCNFFLSHTGTDETSPFDRMDIYEYYYLVAGENVAAGYATPAEVMTGWMNSAGHRANILDPDFAEIGIGYVYNPGDTTKGYKHYWTMDLGAQ
jgi:uncharacterized protein YkwD